MPELLFYQKPTRLNTVTHGKLRFTPLSNFEFASKVNSVPLIAAEFPIACRQYPIVIIGGPDGALSAISGPRRRERPYAIFATEDRRWLKALSYNATYAWALRLHE